LVGGSVDRESAARESMKRLIQRSWTAVRTERISGSLIAVTKATITKGGAGGEISLMVED
jgi:hypothetical protein